VNYAWMQQMKGMYVHACMDAIVDDGGNVRRRAVVGCMDL